ncbi:barstar family protein [Cohnella abietis]|uniref:Putative ribonuclease inhibitor YrdF n=1 Tax=Cohnella abietis TaxID=2507935 RepID=A0A3T1D3I8_9BACL|nr:barstar family protein [Cohnella abietis]BBI32686.1 putative ribonuclease inhibitor YrdF [Cohnella abietis]
MKQVTLNGAKMESIEVAHSYIARKLSFPSYYGHNLDALWDVLSSINENLHITLVNNDLLITSLGDYGRSLVDVFIEAAQESDCVQFELAIK